MSPLIHPLEQQREVRFFGEWMDSIEFLNAFVVDKPIDMEIYVEDTDYMDEDPMVLMLREEGTY